LEEPNDLKASLAPVDGVIGSEIHWSHTFDFEITRGLEALLNSLSFLAPRHRAGMLCCPFRKLEISSTITFGGVVGWGKNYFDLQIEIQTNLE
jgi:hypothetical protein